MVKKSSNDSKRAEAKPAPAKKTMAKKTASGKPRGKAKLDRQREVVKTKLIVVGIGASAGGLEALRLFVADLPKGANMAYVVAQHMSPQHRSMMADLLARETKLDVEEVEDNTPLVADKIFVGPPNNDIYVKDGKLRLRTPISDIGAKPSVDYLFSSMADDLGERAIGIVMSGTGSDGAHGVRAINASGGICIAQMPETAKYDSMPQAAIKAGVDQILSPQDIASQLSSIASHPRVKVAEVIEDSSTVTSLDNIVRNIYAYTRMDFSNYKESTITRQIERRMAVLQMSDIQEYAKFVEDQPDELEALATKFLICVTSFFRDAPAFDTFRAILRKVIMKKRPGDDIRIWVPGCATGEEAYSIAIILAEELGDKLNAFNIQVFATDINPEATQFGRKGIYPETSIENVSPEMLNKYFVQQDRFFQVDRRIRDLVVFANQNLVQDPPFVRLDAITCRNLLIYFKSGLQERVFRIFHYALNPGGILFLGQSETVGQNSSIFTTLDRKLRIFLKRDVPAIIPSSLSATALTGLQSSRQSAAAQASQAAETVDNGRKTLFDAYAPPSVLVSEVGEIVEIIGEVSPYINLKPGRADFSLFNIVYQPMRTELRAIVQKVLRSGDTALTRPIPIKINGEDLMCRAAVRPVSTSMPTENFLLVSFELVEARDLVEAADPEVAGRYSLEQISELEHELTTTRESLQTVIEELETSNEELQSMNEEAQASNEELQASNEELETSNEELQAANEELTTVNDELSMRTQELAEALDDMENIQNSSDLATLVVDSDLIIRRQNRRSMDFFKTEPTLTTQHLASVPLMFEVDDFIDKVRHVNKKGSIEQLEFVRDENTFEMQIFPYQSAQRESVGGAVINIRDVTDKKKALASVMESEKRLRAVIDNASSEIMLKDTTGRFLMVNRNFLENHNLTEEEVIGRRLDEIYSYQVYAPFRALELKVTTTGRSQQTEIYFPLENHPFETMMSTTFPIHNTAGSITGIGVVNTDITQMQEVIKELEEAKDVANAANQAKSQFLSSMSHELRTPLNAILGFGEMLQSENDGLSDKHRDYVDSILDGGRHLLSLVNEVLDLAGIESGAISLMIEPVRLENIIVPCMVMASSLAERMNIQIKNECEIADVEFVSADVIRAKQILINLLSNAIKYNKPGGSVILRGGKTNGGMWRFEVVDTGIGIDLDKQDMVFKPFNRLSLDKTTIEGTGVGLTISKELVESMGGAIGFQSIPNKGSTFWFDLPLTSASKGRVAKPVDDIEIDVRLPQVELPNDTKILYIDKNVRNQFLLEEFFKTVKGIEVLTANDVIGGLGVCRHTKPSAVVLELDPLDANAIEALRVMKSNPEFSAIPLIGLLPQEGSEELEAQAHEWVVESMVKPLKLDRLLVVIERVLAGKS